MFKNMGLAIIMCTAVIGGLLFYERKKQGRIQEKKNAEFWAKEHHANTVRRKDITFLPYLDIPTDRLPMAESTDAEIREYQDTIRTLSGRRIINFSGVTNTELKEEYGVANLPQLSEYDENYTTLVNTLSRWGARLLETDSSADAKVVLEYAVSIGTDISRTYYMLADLYRKEGHPDKIDALIEVASGLNTLMKPSIIQKLQEIRNSSAIGITPLP